MRPWLYYILLVLISTFCYGLVFYIDTVSDPDKFRRALSVVIVFFIFFSTAMYYLAGISSKSKNPYDFSRLFILSISIKMAVFFALLFWCLKIIKLQAGDLGLPLAVIYALFTIFETWFLMRIAKS